MTYLASHLVPLALAFVLLPGTALGSPSVVLKWTGTTGSGATGSDVITVSNTAVETLTLDLVINVEDPNLFGLFVSLKFDDDLGDELNVLSSEELGWSNPNKTRTLYPFKVGLHSSQESTSTKPGQLYTFEGTTTGIGPINANWTFGRIVFTTNPANIATDGDDAASGLFGPEGDDGLFAEDSELGPRDISDSFSFGGAAVNAP